MDAGIRVSPNHALLAPAWSRLPSPITRSSAEAKQLGVLPPKRDLRRYLRAETGNRRPPHARNGRKNGLSDLRSRRVPKLLGKRRIWTNLTSSRFSVFNFRRIASQPIERLVASVRNWESACSCLDRTSGEASDVVLDEKRVDQRHWNRPEKRAGHQLAPVEYVPTDQLGDDADRHRAHRALGQKD